MSTVYLTVDENGKVQAQEGWLPGDGGHFNAKRASKVKWVGDYKDENDDSQGDFTVTFLDVNNNLKPGWPFDGPIQSHLLVEGDGQPKPNLKLKSSDALWLYKVSAPNATALDPIIIVRDSNQDLMIFWLPLLTFLAGVGIAAFFRRGGTARPR